VQAMSRVSPTSLNSVKVLCEHQSTTVIIFSGSAKVLTVRTQLAGNAGFVVHTTSIAVGH